MSTVSPAFVRSFFRKGDVSFHLWTGTSSPVMMRTLAPLVSAAGRATAASRRAVREKRESGAHGRSLKGGWRSGVDYKGGSGTPRVEPQRSRRR